MAQGNHFYNLGDYPEAIRCYKLAITAKPDYAEAFLNIGDAYLRLKNYDEAIYHYKRVSRSSQTMQKLTTDWEWLTTT